MRWGLTHVIPPADRALGGGATRGQRELYSLEKNKYRWWSKSFRDYCVHCLIGKGRKFQIRRWKMKQERHWRTFPEKNVGRTPSILASWDHTKVLFCCYISVLRCSSALVHGKHSGNKTQKKRLYCFRQDTILYVQIRQYFSTDWYYTSHTNRVSHATHLPRNKPGL